MGKIVEHWFHPNNEQLIMKRIDFLTLILLSKKSMRFTSAVANRTSYRLESQLLPKEYILCRAGISATTKWPYNEYTKKHLYGGEKNMPCTDYEYQLVVHLFQEKHIYLKLIYFLLV